jgi:RNA polymerase sigma-70 factor, ECF subfamily
LAHTVDEAAGVALLKRIAVKDRKAFEEFYYLYAEGFGRFLMKMLKQPEWADEAVNDVMLAVWQSAGRYDPERGRLSTWLFGIAHNKGLRLLERNGQHPEESLEEYQGEVESDEDDTPALYNTAQSPDSEPERVAMGWELGEAMVWAFSKLSADHLAVIDLCFGEGYSYQEIADIVGCPINTVKTRLFHARKRLAELLVHKGYSLPTQEKVKQ